MRDQEYELIEKARQKAEEEAADEAAPTDLGSTDPENDLGPISQLPEPRIFIYNRFAELSHEPDYETYWERNFEHNLSDDSYRLASYEFGNTLRQLEQDAPRWRAENLVREAFMRRRIEETIAAGYKPEKIVALVGAFHAPVMSGEFPAMSDAELASLRRRASKLTLMPYSYFKLSSQSGYGAGNQWHLQWTPESEIQLVEAVLLGETIELAAAYKFKQQLDACTSIAEAAQMVGDACQCGLMASMESARQRLQELSSQSSDFVTIASADYQLGVVARYGDVRKFDPRPLLPLVEELFVKGALALSAAANCDNQAAKLMLVAMDEMNKVCLDYHDRVDEPLWIEILQKLSDADDRNPILSGYACAVLLERGLMPNEALAREVSRRVSPGVPADLGAGWFEGLAQRNRYALLARQVLWEQLAGYLASLDDDQFRRALVFLRRAFGSFSPQEKRHIAENLGQYWGVQGDAASELLEQPLTEKEEETLKDLNEFDFGDI